MQRQFEMGQTVSTHAEFIILAHIFMDNALHPMARLGSEHIDSFIPNELLADKKLHSLIA